MASLHVASEVKREIVSAVATFVVTAAVCGVKESVGEKEGRKSRLQTVR